LLFLLLLFINTINNQSDREQLQACEPKYEKSPTLKPSHKSDLITANLMHSHVWQVSWKAT